MLASRHEGEASYFYCPNVGFHERVELITKLKLDYILTNLVEAGFEQTWTGSGGEPVFGNACQR